MRLAALLVVTAACAPEPTHLRAAVAIAIATDDPATATVTAAAQAYAWVDEEYAVRDMVSGIDVRLDLDGVVAPLAESSPGYLDGEPRMGFPERIQLLGDDEARELDHSALFRVAGEVTQDYIRVTIDPPLQDGEVAILTQHPMGSDGGQSERLEVPGSSRVDFPTVRSRIEVQRTVATLEDGDGLRMGGSVRVTRELDVPCLFGESCP